VDAFDCSIIDASNGRRLADRRDDWLVIRVIDCQVWKSRVQSECASEYDDHV